MTHFSELVGATRAAAATWLTRIARHERAVTAALVGLAVLAGLQALRPPEARLVPVVAAAHALAGGAVLTADDLTTIRVPAAAVPTGALRHADAIGLMVAAPMARGEPLTELRVAGPALLAAARSGSVAAPVRVADAGVATLLQVGDRIDLLAVPRDGGPSQTVASDVLVLTLPAASSGLDEGALVLIACSPSVAHQLASAAVSSRISVVLRGH